MMNLFFWSLFVGICLGILYYGEPITLENPFTRWVLISSIFWSGIAAETAKPKSFERKIILFFIALSVTLFGVISGDTIGMIVSVFVKALKQL